jgi:hypothetical protein
MTDRFRRVSAQQRQRLAKVLWAAAAAVMPACSYDWDRLDPSMNAASDSAGAPSQASGGNSGSGQGGTGGGSTGGGSTGGGNSGTGGTVLSCSGSVLTNSDFEEAKPNQAPSDWGLLNNAPDVTCERETALVAGNSSLAMRVDTRSVEPNGAYRALVGNTSGELGSSASAAELTGTLAVRVEQLPSGSKVSLVALFRADGTSDFQELELKALTTTGPSYEVVGGSAQLPAGTTQFGLAVSVPAGALVYIDNACAAVE